MTAFSDVELSKWTAKIFNKGNEPNADLIGKTTPQFFVAIACYLIKHMDRSNCPKWWSPLYDLCRILRTHPQITTLRADEVLVLLREVTHGEPGKYFAMNEFDIEASFPEYWNKYSRLGVNVLNKAIDLALAEVGTSNPYDLYVALIRHLQVVVGVGKPIGLPNRAIAVRLGCLEMTVSRLRQKAVENGLIRLVSKPVHRPGGKGKAAQFEVIG